MGLIETSKDILKAVKGVASIDVQQKVIELQAGILEMQEQVVALQQGNEERM